MISKEQIKGLTIPQVEASRTKFGTNEIPSKSKVHSFHILISQFLSPLIFILLLAAAITFFLEEYIDFIAILLVVIINALLGFLQERQAQKALESLTKIIRPSTTVIRNGEEMTLNTKDIVVGDIVKLKFGDKVPADGIVLNASSLNINESVLTGESMSVVKTPISINDYEHLHAGELDKKHQVFTGTTVLSGFGYFEVRNIGINTQFGKIAQSLSSESESKTPLQKKLQNFSRILTLVVALIASFVFVFGIFTNGDFEEILILSVSLAVSAIPEGLVISLTIILTLGMQRLLKRKALVRKLIVAETLGSVTTICVDKTGTLTLGEMHVIGSQLVDNTLAQKAILACNNKLNAVDNALLEWLKGVHHSNTNIFSSDKELETLPFNSENKFALSIHSKNIYYVGAPEILLKYSDLSSHEKEQWLDKIAIESDKGRRLIGLGYKINSSNIRSSKELNPLLDNIKWLGYMIIEDPIRTSVRQAITDFMNADVKIKVITGDQKTTAAAIMASAGLHLTDQEMLSGEELEKLNEADFEKRLPTIKLFYRTSPEQKYRIVNALQNLGEVVGMMGDGINDAPALKTADVGIVVNNATEVSKETADIVLLDSDLNTITAAIEEGRAIFENLRKVTTYLLSDSSSEIILISLSLLFGLPLPLLPLQILFINLVADGLPDVALAFEQPEKGLMKDKPTPQSAPLLTRQMMVLILTIGVIVNIFIFGVFILLLQMGRPIEDIRSFIFLLLGVDSLFYVYSVRSLRKNIWSMNPFSNKLLNFAVLLGLIVMFSTFYIEPLRATLEITQIGINEIVFIIGLAFVKIVIIEVVKWLFITRTNKRH